MRSDKLFPFLLMVVVCYVAVWEGICYPQTPDLRDVQAVSGLPRVRAHVVNGNLGNPPLPLLYTHEGDYKFTFQPAFFSRGKISDSDGYYGGFTAQGGSVGASYGLSDRWSLHLVAVANTATAGYHGINEVSNALTYEVKNGNIFNFTAAPMIVYQFFGQTEGSFTWNWFLGPRFNWMKFTARAIQNNYDGTPAQDFDLHGRAFQYGFMSGTSMGIPVSKTWMLNPYAVLGAVTERGIHTKATEVRSSATPLWQPNALLAAQSSSSWDTGIMVLSLGANLIYRPLGITVCLTSSWSQKIVASIDRMNSGYSSNMVTVSYSFGSYAR